MADRYWTLGKECTISIAGLQSPKISLSFHEAFLKELVRLSVSLGDFKVSLLTDCEFVV